MARIKYGANNILLLQCTKEANFALNFIDVNKDLTAIETVYYLSDVCHYSSYFTSYKGVNFYREFMSELPGFLSYSTERTRLL